MFKLNLNKTDRGAIMAILAIFGILFVLRYISRTRSGYQPRPIVIKAKTEDSIFGLPHSLECVSGSGKKDAYYSRSLTPGGVCGGQKLVADHANYEISDGIGGVLI
jgi:hypothetical protein